MKETEIGAEPGEETPAVGTPESIAARRARRAKRQGSAPAGDAAADAPEADVEISDEQMRAAPVYTEIHGLRLVLTPLPSGKETAEFQDLLNRWPDDIILCAITLPPKGGGIDWEATARDYADREKSAATTKAKAAKPKISAQELEKIAAAIEVAPHEIADRLGRLFLILPAYLPVMAETIYKMAHATPGLTEESLLETLGALRLQPFQYVDIVRVLWRILGGFPGDMASRF